LLPAGGHEFVNKSRISMALPPRGTLRHTLALTDGGRIARSSYSMAADREFRYGAR
jgi:hypothetical protein